MVEKAALVFQLVLVVVLSYSTSLLELRTEKCLKNYNNIVKAFRFVLLKIFRGEFGTFTAEESAHRLLVHSLAWHQETLFSFNSNVVICNTAHRTNSIIFLDEFMLRWSLV